MASGKQGASHLSMTNGDSLRAVMASSMVGMLVVDASEEVIFLNPAGRRLFHVGDDARLSLRFGELVTCMNRREDRGGCGRTPECAHCPVYAAIRGALAGETRGLEGETALHLERRPDPLWIKYGACRIELGGAPLVVMTVSDISGRKRSEDRLGRITQCLLSLGNDYDENVNRLAALCGELLGATCALYHRLDAGLLCAVGKWQAPPDLPPSDRAEGHICHDVILREHDDVYVVRNLPETSYAKTDPNVNRYGLMTYVGRAVKCGSEHVGALCAVFQEDFEPSDDIRWLLGILAAAIGNEENRKQAEELLRLQSLVLDQIDDCVTVTDLSGVITYVNRAEEIRLGYLAEELIGRPTAAYGEDPDAGATQDQIVEETVEKGRWRGEVVNYTRDGERIVLDCRTQLVFDMRGRPVALCGISTDITERKRAEERFRVMASMLADAPSSITVHDFDGKFLYANRKTFELHGYTAEEFMGLNLRDIDVPESAALIAERMRVIAEHGEADFEVGHYRKDGSVLPLEVYVRRVDWMGRPAILSIGTDVSERMRAERERAELQEDLAQAQKMETVGRLAGGVAHDFNNMLGVIIGHSEMALDHLEPGHLLYNDLYEIRKAAQRSAELTRQLLAFARKQAIIPRLLDLNETIDGMRPMLRRLIGENIELVWSPGDGLWPVRMDPAQVDQILVNLTVNARDAITGVGTIAIGTDAAVFDEARCEDVADATPGEYVVLTVRDTGAGVPEDVMQHLFEPFYTTKASGKGTGLGLATIYGIARQNAGFVEVDSEPGRGTTFRVYLPRATQAEPEEVEAQPAPQAVGGTETVLLVEDETAILNLVTLILQHYGYTVLAAASPGEALAIAADHPGSIDLLITDMVMPEMSGRALRDALQPLRPDIRTLFISGYTTDALAEDGILGSRAGFLQKPFSRAALAVRVRELLDA